MECADFLHHSFGSPFGDIVIIWRREGTQALVRRVFIGRPGGPTAMALLNSRFPGSPEGCAPSIEAMERGVSRMLRGEEARLDRGILDMSLLSGFRRRVLLTEAMIPAGSVRSYRWLAHRVAGPGHARAVGTALASNPFPLVIPCHRTIRSDGSLGGYQGGILMKRALLEIEGIRFDEDGSVLTPFV